MNTNHPHPQKGRNLRIAVVSSFSRSLTNFRLELLKRMAEGGHTVFAFGPEHDEVVIETLAGIGVTFVKLPMSRTGTNPLADVFTLCSLVRQFRVLKPDIVLSYTMKPIIYGGIAARLTGVDRFYALVTGLGHVFSETESGGKASLVRKVSIWLYRIALRDARRVMVYNEADARDIQYYTLINDMSRLSFVPGSGVDLVHFRQTEPPSGRIVFLMVARLLRDKGVYEYVEAARQLKMRYPAAVFNLLGQLEPHGTGVTSAELEKWAAEGVVDYLGEVRDVRPILADCSVFVLPTYYREGIPRSILEAMATGRAIVTTNMPGCRETVVDNRSGLLVPARDPVALAKAMERFLLEPGLINEFGEQARQLAVGKFDVHAVNSVLLRDIEIP